MLILVLLLILGSLFIFILGRIIYRKRQVDEVYKKISPLLQKRNEQIALQLSNNSILLSEPAFSSVQILLNQATEEELDLFETLAIQNRINQYFDESFLEQLSEREDTKVLYNALISSNLQLKEARECFNMAATYHNYSVEFFPTKTLSKLLGYQTVPQLTYPSEILKS